MSFNMSFEDVLSDAKKAFKEIDRSPYEKYKSSYNRKLKPILKDIGFINGMRKVVVWA